MIGFWAKHGDTIVDQQGPLWFNSANMSADHIWTRSDLGNTRKLQDLFASSSMSRYFFWPCPRTFGLFWRPSKVLFFNRIPKSHSAWCPKNWIITDNPIFWLNWTLILVTFFFCWFLESQIPSVHLMFAFPIPYWGPQSWSSTRWIAWSPAASLAQNLNWMEGMEGSEHALDKLHDCVTDSFLWGCVKIAAIFLGRAEVDKVDMGFQAASWPCSGSTVTWSSHDINTRSAADKMAMSCGFGWLCLLLWLGCRSGQPVLDAKPKKSTSEFVDFGRERKTWTLNTDITDIRFW